jgi:hypothetical protein
LTLLREGYYCSQKGILLLSEGDIATPQRGILLLLREKYCIDTPQRGILLLSGRDISTPQRRILLLHREGYCSYSERDIVTPLREIQQLL